MNEESKSLLNQIHSPEDLKKLKVQQLPQLGEELRAFIIDEATKNPGHLGATLGTIELTMAIHYVFNTPYDKVVWDVGHQAYAHKILTGRRERFHTNRKLNGISGFPKMEESEYDTFGVGHSSTSISATLGMAVASSLLKDDKRQHIAVIGDGAMTGGMAMEALNNAGVANSNILVILNDNGIAIDKNVGALKEYFAHINASKAYNRFREIVWTAMGGKTKYGKNSRAIVKQIRHAVKSSISNKNNLFEAFNFRYFGPVDGHDVHSLVKILRDLKNIEGPKLLHCITVKGKGFEKAEQNQVKFHAPGYFDKTTGEQIKQTKDKKEPPKYQHVFGETIVELAKKNEKIVGVTPAMPSGSSLNIMMEKMPNRAFDVGIAEQHAVTFSAGMAVQGLIPFCNIYSSFMQRAYDQVIHDVALQKLDVVFCLDRGGLVGEDGATHHGVFDLAYFRCIPNMIVAAPMNEKELRNMMYTAQKGGYGPFSIRYPRGKGVMPNWRTPFETMSIGKGEVLRQGDDVAIVSIGHPGNDALAAAQSLEKEDINVAVYNMRFLKPIDEDLLHTIFKSHKHIITVEDGTIVGGLGSAIEAFKNQHSYMANIHKLGVPDKFVEHGTRDELIKKCGFDKDSMINLVKKITS